MYCPCFSAFSPNRLVTNVLLFDLLYFSNIFWIYLLSSTAGCTIFLGLVQATENMPNLFLRILHSTMKKLVHFKVLGPDLQP